MKMSFDIFPVLSGQLKHRLLLELKTQKKGEKVKKERK